MNLSDITVGFEKQYFSNGTTVPYAETNGDPIPVILAMIQAGLPLEVEEESNPE